MVPCVIESFVPTFMTLACALVLLLAADLPAPTLSFLENRCFECHDAETKKGDLDLTALAPDFAQAENFARWVKVHDRIESGDMPPKKKERPTAEELKPALAWMRESLTAADAVRHAGERTTARRLTRVEYENTMRDLFDLKGITLMNDLPGDGMVHGFDKNAGALDVSHVNIAKYVEAADKVLNAAIVSRPEAPLVEKQRISLAESYIVRVVLTQSDAVLLRDGKPDPILPIAGEHRHVGLGEHEKLGLLDPTSTVGIFRHEDDAFNPGFNAWASVFGGDYKLKLSLWSFGWDKGTVTPARGTEAVRLSVVQLQNKGHGGGHPSFTLGHFDAPPDQARIHELTQWFNPGETIGYNAASLVPRRVGEEKGRAMNFVGPGVACDWLEVEGPFHDQWPPKGHRALFGELPIAEVVAKDHPGVRFPDRPMVRQEMIHAINRPTPLKGLWTVKSEDPKADADRLLTSFLPKAFRRPVTDEVRAQYLGLVEDALANGECFELAMRGAYQAALCSPDFLYHVEAPGKLDAYALASRLSYFLWNSMPDEELLTLAQAGKLNDPAVLRAQTERLLKGPLSQRFIEDFLGQWLKLRAIAANDPDRKLYPEFSPYLQESMVAETQAYFRELLEKDLNASYLVRSDFAMVNETLARHYGIDTVKGTQIRRVALPADCPRGGFLTQAAILKVTANGTTTSPVPRGAFVMERLLGHTPEPPPSSVPAVEPDVRGATTIREQLDKHRSDPSCAACHAKIDPPGFALESFDVIGGFRTRYRSIEIGDKPEQGLIDPFVRLGFKLGPVVDASGEMPDGRPFKDIREFQDLAASDTAGLLANLARQFATYATGREVTFGDREAIREIVAKTQAKGGGVRALLHEVIQSPIFLTR